MTDIPPDLLAQADQEIASMETALDKGVEQYRKEVAYRGEPRALGFTQKSLVESVNGQADVEKLAWVAAIALRRLAGEQPVVQRVGKRRHRHHTIRATRRTTVTGPKPPAEGRKGRWVKIGNASVDSATMAITDPQFNETDAAISGDLDHSAWSNGFGTGIQFSPGFGDGGYDIWAWIVDYGEDDEVDERIAQVVVTMIDADELAAWRHDEPWPYIREENR